MTLTGFAITVAIVIGVALLGAAYKMGPENNIEVGQCTLSSCAFGLFLSTLLAGGLTIPGLANHDLGALRTALVAMPFMACSSVLALCWVLWRRASRSWKYGMTLLNVLVAVSSAGLWSLTEEELLRQVLTQVFIWGWVLVGITGILWVRALQKPHNSEAA